MEQEKHATYWKEEWRKIQYGRVAELRRECAGSPHCPLDIRGLRLVDGTSVWWSISREWLLWWPCSRQIGGRQRQNITKKLHLYIYAPSLLLDFLSLCFWFQSYKISNIPFCIFWYQNWSLFKHCVSVINCVLSPQAA